MELVNFTAGEQLNEPHRAVSPLGKVPLMVIDGRPLLENAAILTLAHSLRPAAEILPRNVDALTQAEAAGGLSFCGGTLHPIVRGLINPLRVTTGEVEPVRERSRELAATAFGYAERRLAEGGWWLGELSIVDVYLDWAFSGACRVPFETATYPRLRELPAKLMDVPPAYGRMQAAEERARAALGL